MVFAIVKALFGMPVRVAVLAAMLNTSLSTVQKWQIGEKHPGGPSKKILSILDRKGIDAMI